MIRNIIFGLVVLVASLAAEVNATTAVNFENSYKIEAIKKKISLIDDAIKENLWFKRYENYITYQELAEELAVVNSEVKNYKSKTDKTSKERYDKLSDKKELLEKQLELLGEFQNSPFAKLIEPLEIPMYQRISNPLAIISAFSYIKQIKQDNDAYKTKIERLSVLLEKLSEKQELQTSITQIEPTKENEEAYNETQQEIDAFRSAMEIANTTYNLSAKKVEEVTIRVNQDISAQIKRAFIIGIVIVIVIVISLLFKLGAKKYIEDNERFYMANKVINFVNFTLIIFILLFSYIDNVAYIVTVLGFASAGIAIAMKDWFMSILGWTVITFGGSFHVGDRLMVLKDGIRYVGDIIDISLLRMTVLEDITLTTYEENRRSGRVVFIPNNYIFTTLISNYTHGTLRTVWDGIDVFITFDSNHKKATHLVREIVKKYSKGY
ncbi:MAG: mechanosensitive ion channel, partial [Sulfurospirillaceae bacterium]|nr:mechanosensitive ion channel [Sulfurospirillaceae bacterium]